MIDDASADVSTKAFGDTLVFGDVDSPPMVILHGWGSGNAAWADAGRQLGKRFRVVALNYPGTGQTEWIGSYSVPEHARWVLETLSQVGIDRFVLIGHSMGGNVAAQVALSAPGRVRALILNAPALYSERLRGAIFYLMPVSGPIVLATTRLGSRLQQRAGSLCYRLMRRRRLGAWTRTRYLFADGTPLAFVREQLGGLIRNPLRLESLPAALPVLLIHGTRDRVIPLRHSRDMLASRPVNTTLLIYRGIDHNAMDADPKRLAGDIEQFVDELG